MFTGIVESLGTVQKISEQHPGMRLIVGQPALAGEARLGESIAVNGCCLTVVSRDQQAVGFDVGSESLSRTNLGKLNEGSFVNLERSLRVGDQLGGHFVTGHIDAVGSLHERRDEGDWSTLWFDMPTQLAKQMVSKGSIAVDGVSLTLVEVERDQFSVALIPHTLRSTTLGTLRTGDEVNLETDMLAKLIEKQLQQRR